MGVFLDGFDLFIIAIALPLIAVDFGANRWEQGIVGAAAVLGAIAGAVTMGRLADKAVFASRRFHKPRSYAVNAKAVSKERSATVADWNRLALFRISRSIPSGSITDSMITAQSLGMKRATS